MEGHRPAAVNKSPKPEPLAQDIFVLQVSGMGLKTDTTTITTQLNLLLGQLETETAHWGSLLRRLQLWNTSCFQGY